MEHEGIELNVYPVIAYRDGYYERHSYLVGVYSAPELAQDAADDEEEDRGGKYFCEIIEVPMDDDYDVIEYFRRIRELPLRNTDFTDFTDPKLTPWNTRLDPLPSNPEKTWSGFGDGCGSR